MKYNAHLIQFHEGDRSHPINFPVSQYFILHPVNHETILKRSVFSNSKKPTYPPRNVGFFLFEYRERCYFLNEKTGLFPGGKKEPFTHRSRQGVSYPKTDPQ